ncbi:MAG: hypothetical protein ACPF9D_07485 [Owenweeksia sp.]
MPDEFPCNERILELLRNKSAIKQKVYRQTMEVFERLKVQLSGVAGSLDGEICKVDEHVKLEYRSKSKYEAEIQFSGDVLLFNMHTNVFTFDKEHQVWKMAYVKEDRRRGYFGMINIYNFLADSFRFNRVNDVGVLLGRIFINHEGHFFIEGKRQLGFLYNQLGEGAISDKNLKKVVDTAIIYALEYDLTVPNLDEVLLASVGQVQTLSSELHLKTSKKLGFKFHTKMEKEE